MSVIVKKGNYPHTAWIDLKMNGVLVECIVMKTDAFGNISYIEINKLDKIDKNRLLKILSNRNAHSFELWDLMSQITLNNGVNALTYFHQLVQVITPQGVIMSPRAGEVGIGSGVVDTNVPTTQQAAVETANATTAVTEQKTTARRAPAKKKTKAATTAE